ncbi:MAG: phenylacetate--CoA ligase [Planctomycetes bacterium]|nr:phenylacetate--CoA ligase [Planctomycetota bacterium]
MTGHQYWNPKNETLSRDELHQLQLAKLKRLVAYSTERSAFHRGKIDEAGVTADSLTSIDDLQKIPFTTRDEWMESQERSPMFGDLLARPREDAIRYHLTSGTSGRNPLRVLDSRRDWQWISECWAYGFWAAGVRPTDTVFFAFSYGSFIGFWGAHYCCERMGSLVIPSGNMTTDMRVRQIADMKVSTVCATPTYALRLAQAASEQGIDLVTSAVDKVIVSGEPAGSIPETKALIERQWGAKCFDTAGMTELGTICMFECSHQPGGMHIIEDHYIEEVIDPTTGNPADYGERGERVVTSFGRGMIPVLRYKTRDLVVKVPHHRCSCGRTFDVYEGGIQGRVDDMLLIRGTNVYPRAIESIVRSFPTIDEFQILVETINNVDELTVRVEMKPETGVTFSDIERELVEDLKEHHEMLRMNVAQAETGSLPRFELKAKRVVDQRSTKA